MNTRVQVARSMVWTVLESFGVSGLSIIGLIVVARYVTPAEMGVAAMAQGIVQLLNIPVEFMFLDALIRKKDAEEIDFDTAHVVSVVMGIAVSLLCWFGSGGIATLLHVPEIASVLAWMGLSTTAMGFGAVIVARQRRQMEFRVLAIRSFMGRLCGVTVGIIIALAGGGVWSLVAQQILMVGFATLVLWIQAKARPRLRFSYGHFKDLAAFGMRTIATAWLNLSVQRIFTLFVGSCLSTAAAGYLNIAFRIVDILRDIVVNAVYQLALPMFSRHSESLEQLERIYITSLRFTSAVTFPLFAGLALCSVDFMQIVFGAQWQLAAPYVTLLAFLTLVFFSRIYSNPLLTAQGYPHLPLISDLGALVVIIAGMSVLQVTGTMTLEFAAALWALRLLVSVPIDMRNIKIIVHIPFYEQIVGTFVPFVGVLAMVVVMMALHAVLGSFAPLARIIIMAGAGSAAYGVTLLLLDRQRITDLWQFGQLALKRS